MSDPADIIFNQGDEAFSAATIPAARPQAFDLTGKVMTWGVARDRRQAEYVLAGVAIGALVLAFFLWRAVSGGGSGTVPQSHIDAAFQNGVSQYQ